MTPSSSWPPPWPTARPRAEGLSGLVCDGSDCRHGQGTPPASGKLRGTRQARSGLDAARSSEPQRKGPQQPAASAAGSGLAGCRITSAGTCRAPRHGGQFWLALACQPGGALPRSRLARRPMDQRHGRSPSPGRSGSEADLHEDGRAGELIRDLAIPALAAHAHPIVDQPVHDADVDVPVNAVGTGHHGVDEAPIVIVDGE